MAVTSDIVRSLVGPQLGQSEQDFEGHLGHQSDKKLLNVHLNRLCTE